MVCIGLLLMTITFINESPALPLNTEMYDFSPLDVMYGYTT